jgi:DNA-binding transcriptional ArsR family regulator
LNERKSVSLQTDTRMDSSVPIGGPELDERQLESFTEGFKALADPHRLKILHLLLRCGEMCVCECMPALGLSQSNLSFHLKTLKTAGFINARKSGKWMYYSLNRPAFEEFTTAFGAEFDLEKWPEKPRSTVCDDAGHCTSSLDKERARGARSTT